MNNVRVKLVTVVTIVCSMMSAGCGISQSASNQGVALIDEPVEQGSLANVNKMDHLAAINLVNTMMQVPRLHPGALSEVQMHEPDRRFGRYVSEVMEAAGYDVQHVNRRDGDVAYLTYSRALGPVISSYKIGIDEFKIRRSYTVEEDLVLPASSIFVFGADPDVINSDDSIFDIYDASERSFGVEAIR